MKRVLVTGASGFIGRHCLPLLARAGYEVSALSARPSPGGLPDADWRQVNLLDAKAVADVVADVRPTHLLHLAWFTAHGEYWTSPENLRWVRASLDLLEAFVSTGGHRAVVAGTCAEYDWRYGYCSEFVTPLVPRTLYGASKHALQVILSAYASRFELSAAWGRVFLVYGPHEHPARLVPYVIRSTMLGKPAECTDGNQVRDFLYVSDVADALVALLDSSVVGPVNIASGKPVIVGHVISRIAELQQRPDLVQLGTISRAEDDPPVLLADVNRLSCEVGWTPQYELDKGLKETIDWWKLRSSAGDEHAK